MIGRRQLLLGGLAAGAALGLGACGKEPAPSGGSATKVTVGLTYIPNVQFSAFYVGVEKGLFEGLDVTLRHHGEQEDVFGAVLKGEEDVVFASADEAMVAAAGGKTLRSFATAYQTYPLEVLGIGERDLPENPLRIIQGARLGIPGHFGSSYYAALAAIHQAGLTDADLTLQDIGYTQLSALASGNVDFIMGFRNNELVQLRGQGKTVTAVPVVDPAAPQLVGPSLITAGGPSDDVLRAIADGMRRAEEAIVADPEIALEATAGQVPALADSAQREAAKGVLQATSELWLVDGKVNVGVDQDAFTRMGDFLTSAGIIEKAPEQPFVAL
ncbi:MAG: ABC transporter substrate-binding protein [Arachnia sp.]